MPAEMPPVVSIQCVSELPIDLGIRARGAVLTPLIKPSRRLDLI